MSWQHLAFDGRLLHGALHDLAPPSSEPSAFVRVTLLVNLWIDHAPVGARRLPSTLLDGLSDVCMPTFCESMHPIAPVPMTIHDARGRTSDASDGRQLEPATSLPPWRSLSAAIIPPRGAASRGSSDRAHMPFEVSGLPEAPTACVEAPSLVHAAHAKVRLPSVRSQRLAAAATELRASGDWRARDGLMTLLPARDAAELKLASAGTADGAHGSALSTRTASASDGERISGRSHAEPPLAADVDADGGQEVAAEGDGGQEVAAEGDGGQEVGLRWIGGEPILIYLAAQQLEACACLALPHLDATHLDAGDPDGFTALHFACNLGLPRLVRALVAAGASVDARTRDVSQLREPGGRTPLHLAASTGSTGIVETMLSARADASAEDWMGSSPFVLACRHGHHALASTALRPSATGSLPRCHADAADRAASAASAAVFEMPSEEMLHGLQLAENLSVRTRGVQRRCILERPALGVPFELAAPLFSAAECAALVAAANQAAARLGGWQSKRHRHHPTVDLPAYDVGLAQYHLLRHRLDAVALPALRAQYATRALAVRESFVVKYEAACGYGKQSGLDMHQDGSLLNCVVTLNDLTEYDGGGTAFAPPLDHVYRLGCGACLCSCGQLLHGAAPVVRGTRYVLIAFIDEEQPIPTEEEDDE